MGRLVERAPFRLYSVKYLTAPNPYPMLAAR